MCRQIEIKTSKCTLLAFELPEDATNIRKGAMDEFFYDTKFGYEGMDIINLPDGNWQHIGTLDQMTEEVWKGIVDNSFSFGLFANYCEKVEFGLAMRFDTATESGLSLLRANGVLLDNPHGNMPVENNYEYVTSHTGIEDYNRDIERWQEAESKLFDRNRTQFFIRKQD